MWKTIELVALMGIVVASATLAGYAGWMLYSMTTDLIDKLKKK